MVSQRKLAKLRNVPYSTLAKRAMRERWNQRARIMRKAAAGLESDFEERAQLEIRKELAPFIEKNKTKITKRGVELYKRGIKRIEKIWASQDPTDPKKESEAAKAVETLFRVGRTALGMNDGSSPTGSINLNILTNQAAVQVNSQS